MAGEQHPNAGAGPQPGDHVSVSTAQGVQQGVVRHVSDDGQDIYVHFPGLAAEGAETDCFDRADIISVTAAGPEPAPGGGGAPGAAAEAEIRAAYQRLAGEPGAWVSLRRLRAQLAGLDPAAVDEALLRMGLGGGEAILAPEANQKTLTPADREAAVRQGGQDKHLICIPGLGGESAQPAAGPAPPREEPLPGQPLPGQPRPAPAPAEQARDEAPARLAAAQSRTDAADYLAGLKLSKPALVSLARQLDIAVSSKDTVPVIQQKIVEGTAGAREDAAAVRDRSWRGHGTPPAGKAPRPVSGALSDQPLAENGWGHDPSLPVCYHEDGPIGTAVRGMGRHARIDVDGEPLGNLLGRRATDVVMGRRTAEQALEDFKSIRDRLPEGSPARARLDRAIADMDAPPSPAPALPPAAPAPLRKLMEDLHAVPLVRRDPSEERDALQAIAEDFAAGKTGGLRMIAAVRQLGNRRHESLGECGKTEIDRAVAHAVDALETLRATDRAALYPPGRQGRP